MDLTTWVGRATRADNPQQVITLVNEYIASRDPGFLLSLPRECQVAAVTSAEEVSDIAYRLAAYHSHDDIARDIQRISAFFARAAIRLAEMEKERRESARAR
jgi:hypothetical protein